MQHIKEEVAMKDHTKIALLEQSIGHINESLLRLEKTMEVRFDKIDRRFDMMEKRFETVDRRFDFVDKRFDAVQHRLWTNFFWTMGGFLGILSLLAKIHHWF